MTDLHYTDPRLAQLYDQEGDDRADLAFYLSFAATTPCRILDLGCGTGTISLAFADRGHRVTGVDPAAAMRPSPPRRRVPAASAGCRATRNFFFPQRRPL